MTYSHGMTAAEAVRSTLEAYEAWEKDKSVALECYSGVEWGEWIDEHHVKAARFFENVRAKPVRIKPIKKLVPFTQETLAKLLLKHNVLWRFEKVSPWYHHNGISEDGIDLYNCGLETFSALLDHYEYTTDGQTWHPAGVVEC